MVKAADLRRIVYGYREREEAKELHQQTKDELAKRDRLKSRRGLISDEIKRLEKIMLQEAKRGHTKCYFSLGYEIDPDDPVLEAIQQYCVENNLRCNDVSHEKVIGINLPVSFQNLEIIW